VSPDRSHAATDQDRIWDYYQNEGRAGFAGTDARLLYLVRQLRPGTRVLNIGIGGGLFEEAALRRGLEVYSLDPSARAIESLQQRLGLGDRARVGYGQAMPFDAGMFDAVVASEVLEHLTDPVLAGTLTEIDRVLRSGGQLLGTVPADEDLQAQVVICPDCGSAFHRWGHVQSFSTERMRTLLSRTSDVQEVVVRHFVSWSTLNWKGRIEAAVRQLLWSFGVRGGNPNLLFRAIKPGDPGRRGVVE
jgi:SAM-dependent methyltransferase